MARLDNEQVRELAERAHALLDLALGFYRIHRSLDRGLAIHWQGRANFAATLLGRLVVRLATEAVRRVVESAIAYFKRGEVDHPSMQQSFTFLFKQALQSLPIDQRMSFLVEFISMPLSDNQRIVFSWPEPALDLQGPSALPDRKTFGPTYTLAVRHQIDLAKGTSELARKQALLRLAVLHDLGLLDVDEDRALADAIWVPIEERGLPWNDAFTDNSLLRLPEREPGEALRAWRRGYLSAESPDPFDIADAMRNSRAFDMVAERLRAVTSAAMSTRGGSPLFSLDASEAALLARQLLALLSRVANQTRRPFSFDLPGLALLAQHALAEAAIPHIDQDDHATTHELRESLDALDAKGVPTLDARIALIRLVPHSQDAVQERVERDLRSHRPEIAGAALDSVYRWLLNGGAWHVPRPSDAILFGVAMIVEDLWPDVLERALLAADAAVVSGDQRLTPRFVNPLLRGLFALLVAADYQRADFGSWSGIKADDLPSVRAAAARLAVSLSSAGYKTERIIQQWIETAAEDPLPEVRHTVRGQDRSGCDTGVEAALPSAESPPDPTV